MKENRFSFLIEIAAWVIANVVCVVLPTTAVYFIGTDILDWGPARTSFYVTMIALATLTWGSWAALIWTKTRVLRVAMRGSSVLPGLITIAFGVVGGWVGFGALYIWLMIIFSGAGMIVLSSTLSKTLGATAAPNQTIGLLAGGVGFPLLTTIVALGISGMWYQFVTNPFDGDWRSLISVATVMVSLLAMALVSTVVPAITSSFLQRACHIGAQQHD